MVKTLSQGRNRGRYVDKAEPLQAIMDAGRRIHMATDSIDTIVSDKLGISRNDLRCLQKLKSGPVTPGDIACHTRLTSGSVTALLDRLESAGYVERRRSESDRRSIEVAMPDAKLAEMTSYYGELQQAIRDFLDGLDARELAKTAKALTLFAQALEFYSERHGKDGWPDKPVE